MLLDASPTEDWRWTAVLDRDTAADGRFVYAVASTRIYCRPTCPSRRPHRRHVRFFATPAAAEAEGTGPAGVQAGQVRARHRAASARGQAVPRRAPRRDRDAGRLGRAVGLSPVTCERDVRGTERRPRPTPSAAMERMEGLASTEATPSAPAPGLWRAAIHLQPADLWIHARARIGINCTACGAAARRLRIRSLRYGRR